MSKKKRGTLSVVDAAGPTVLRSERDIRDRIAESRKLLAPEPTGSAEWVAGQAHIAALKWVLGETE